MSGQDRTKGDTATTGEILYSLTVRHEKAVEALIMGATDQDAAEAAGVTRQTVNGWKLHHPAFRAELNRRRAEESQRGFQRRRKLREKALDVLEAELAKGNLRAALAVLRFVSASASSSEGPTEPREIVANDAYSAAISDVLTPSFEPTNAAIEAKERELIARLAQGQ